MMIIKNALFLLLLGWAACEDLKNYRVSNKNILLGHVFGVLCMIITKGAAGLKLSLTGSFTALLIGYFLWKINIFKAGDAKLIWMIGTFEGVNDMWITIAMGVIAAGITAFIMMIRDHSVKDRLVRIKLYIESIFISRKMEGYRAKDDDHLKLPFATACFSGILIYKLFQGIYFMCLH